MTETAFFPPPIPNGQLDALVAAASPQELRRALRIVLGAEQAYWERDLQTGTMWYSPSFFRVLGLPPTLDREQINSRIHPGERQSFERAYGAAVEVGGPFSYDVRYRDAGDNWRWARAFGRVWIDEQDGRPLRLIGTMLDVHAERQARLDANEHARRYQRALDAATEAYFERTPGPGGFFVSDNFTTLLGYPAGTPVPDERTFLHLWVHPEDRPRLDAEVVRARQHPGTWECTYRLRQADGGWRWFRGRGRSELAADGRVRMCGMVGDVHQQQLDREELDQHRHHLRRMVAERTERLDAALDEAERQREQAERASRAKSEFLAHMSHELRTPLNGLLGLTELALQVAEQPAQRRYLDVALGSGRALQQLIGHVLDYSQLDAGRIELATAPFDLAELVAELWRSLMPDVRSPGVAMRYDWLGEPVEVLGDASRVRQVIVNLVANAAKFTERGHITVRGAIETQRDGSALARVRVEDSGCGIDEAQRERVFDAFVQGDASLTRPHGGAGLGLAIARRLARAMGGDVTLEASSPRGSTFCFSWPVEPVAPAAAAARPAAGHAWLVYQERDIGAWLAGRLERLGWTCDVIAGLDMLGRRLERRSLNAPDLVIVSQSVFEGAAGADLAPLGAVLPTARVVLLVAPHWNRPGLEAQALALGAAVHVAPLTPRDLASLLGSATRAARERPPPPPCASASRVLIVEDNPVNLMIATEFVRRLGYEVATASDGAQALQACLEHPPQVVLMDLQMPVMDGLEATRRLRAEQASRRLAPFRIIALTAHAGAADRQQALMAGVDDYLVKPLLYDALRASLDRLLASAPQPQNTETVLVTR
jgi:signal transduction histidine kinase/ActR/RegA family two-component response regulator